MKNIEYKLSNEDRTLKVCIINRSVWLTKDQITQLFGRQPTALTRRINLFIKNKKIDAQSTIYYQHTTQSTAPVILYNTNIIRLLSDSLNDQAGKQFCIWAELQRQPSDNIIEVIDDYQYALDILDYYDYQNLSINQTSQSNFFRANYENAIDAVNQLRKKFNSGCLFANEKDQSFRSSINTIYQTFDGEELYPSIEEKAAMLLYLVVKNHSFSDGNKRIAAFLFLWFLHNNGILYKTDGSKLIKNNALVALTLMIAESRTEEKDMIVKLIVNLINKNN
jgi:prophage maintenance system killer protein